MAQNYKFYTPNRPHQRLVHRPRIFARLDQSLREGRLTLISAPSGFGKSTLVSTWLPTRHEPASWLNLNPADNDPARFFADLVTALQVITPTLGRTAQTLLTSGLAPQVDVLTNVLLNDLENDVTSGLLVLDNYYSIQTEAVHTALATLVRQLPPTLHVVVISRTPPPLPLDEWERTGALSIVTEQMLAFSNSDATRFLNDTLDLNLPESAVNALAQHTGGRPAYLYLAGKFLQTLKHVGPSAQENFIANFSREARFEIDSLLEDLLQTQPPHISTLLAETAIVEVLTPALATAITHLDDTSVLLGQLAEQELFIRNIGPEGEFYTLHSLWREAFLQRLSAISPDRVARLHSRAAAYYAQNGAPEAAIQHLLASDKPSSAAPLIEQTVSPVVESGQIHMLLHWLSRLPDSALKQYPTLAAYYAWALLLNERYDEAAARLASTEQLTPLPQAVSGMLNAIRATMATRAGSATRAVQYASTALDLLPDDMLSWRSRAAFHLGTGHLYNGNLFAAGQALSTAVQISLISRSTPTALLALHTLATVQQMQGNLRWAAQSHRQALNQISKTSSQHLPQASAPYIGLAELHYEWNDLPAAESYLQTGLERARLANNLNMLVAGYYLQARLNLAHGLPDASAFAIDTAYHYARQEVQSQPLTHWLTTQRLGLLIQQDKHEEVVAWINDTTLTLDDEITPFSEFEYLIFARALIYTNNLLPANTLLRRLIPAARENHRNGRVIEGLTLLAMGSAAAGETSDAASAIDEALSLATPERYTRLFVDAGAPMQALLQGAAVRSNTPEAVQRLLSCF